MIMNTTNFIIILLISFHLITLITLLNLLNLLNPITLIHQIILILIDHVYQINVSFINDFLSYSLQYLIKLTFLSFLRVL
jgi:hypothetical protein